MRLTWLFLLIGCSTLVAADWRATRQLPASEAHQAAAAEGKFVYAITSRAVAKYDRASGKRVAVSTGAAKHLNSGFFWKGKLLCAHSNYPLKPERSEIKVLDTDSMKLATFKDFGNAGGSLVWALLWRCWGHEIHAKYVLLGRLGVAVAMLGARKPRKIRAPGKGWA